MHMYRKTLYIFFYLILCASKYYIQRGRGLYITQLRYVEATQVASFHQKDRIEGFFAQPMLAIDRRVINSDCFFANRVSNDFHIKIKSTCI